MGQVQPRQLQAVGSLHGGQPALGEGGLLGRKIGRSGLPVVDHRIEALHLQRVDSYLTFSHLQNLLLINDLDIGLGHRDADVIARFLQVLRGCLQVQLAQGDVVLVAHTVEQDHVGTQAETRVGGIRVGVGIVGGQAAPERKVLGSVGRHAGQAAGTGRAERDFALLDLQGTLLHGEAVLQCVGDALREGPGRASQRLGSCLLSGKTGQDGGQPEQDE